MRVKCETRRQVILDVASEVFREHGFEQSSMSEITARVGGSKATLYNYFASKEELFVEVMQRFAQEQMDYVFAELDPDKDLQQSLLYFGEQFVSILSEEKFISVMRVAYAEAGRTNIGRQFYTRGPGEGRRRLAAYFEKCMVLGKLRTVNAYSAAMHFAGLLRAERIDLLLMDGCERDDLPEVKDVVARAVDVFMRAYAVEKTR